MSKFAIMIPIPVGIVLCVPLYAVPIVQILHVHSVSLLHFGQSFYQDFPLDCPLCRLHVPVPTMHPLPLIHGIVPWTVLVYLACSCPTYPSPFLDPWDCPMDCLLCPLHVPVPTIHPLPLIHGIVPWTVFCVPCMLLSQLSIPFP